MPFTGSVEHQLALRNLVDTYNDAVFRRDADAWEACWTQDAVWDLAGMEVKGRDTLVQTWKGAMEGFPFVAFFAQIGSMEVGGNSAKLTVYTHEFLEMPDGSIRRPLGLYHDSCVQDADGTWRFSERKFKVIKEWTA